MTKVKCTNCGFIFEITKWGEYRTFQYCPKCGCNSYEVVERNETNPRP